MGEQNMNKRNVNPQEKDQQHDPHPVAVRGLQKSFGVQKVLSGVDISVSKGEVLTVLGRSGTGKSVLLKLLVGLERPDAGSVCVQNQEITELPLEKLNEVRKKIGFLFQQAALYDSMTIEQNVMFPLARHTGRPVEEQKARAHELLSNVGLDADLDKMPAELSGGMKKRVGLARALALDPEIIMFDEPTAGLDPISAAEIGALILKLKEERGITSIVVTHDLHSAKSISDQLVVLNEGKIAFTGSFDELMKSQDSFVSKFLKDAA
jgi:phospholipid/cholesterol/gamma-HCH transport system ATP-binding protein